MESERSKQIAEIGASLFVKIAPMICHQSWCAYQLGVGQAYNIVPTDDQLKSLQNGVEFFRKKPNTTAEENHDNWMRHKIEDGWTFGLAKDVDNKRHPDLRPWKELPLEEQKKDIQHLEAMRFAFELAFDIAKGIVDKEIDGC